MADDYKRPFRSNDPTRRPAEPPRSTDNGDPLAELARLIGQNDPFAEYGRTSSRDSQSREMPQPRDLPLRNPPSRDLPPRDLPPRDLLSRDLPPRDLPQRDFHSRDLPPRGYPASQATPEWPPSLGSSSDRRYEAEPRSAGRDSYPAFGDYAPSRSTGRDAIAQSDEYLAARGVGRETYVPRPTYDDYAAQAPVSQAPPREDTRWADTQQYGDTPSESTAQGHDYPDEAAQAANTYDENDGQYYQDDAPLQPEDEETYDDAPSAYRRGGIATALALIGCALLGTAGAYAYRSYAHPTVKEPPPVISADNTTPTKVPAPAADARSSKSINERFATAGHEQRTTGLASGRAGSVAGARHRGRAARDTAGPSAAGACSARAGNRSDATSVGRHADRAGQRTEAGSHRHYSS